MLVKELFTTLSYGILSNLSMSNEGSGDIEDEYHGKMISYINAALTQLYRRFNIRENHLIINQVPHITVYHLKKQFALSSGSDELYKYIIDTNGEPFKEDVLRVLNVSDDTGRMRHINDPEDPMSVYLPMPLALQVPNPVANQGLAVTYQASAIPLEFAGLSKTKYLNQEIQIPKFFEEALINYVAHLVYTYMNGQEYRMYGQEYLAKYEMLCMEITGNNLVNFNPTTETNKFYDRGFV